MSMASSSNPSLIPVPMTLLKDVKPMLHNFECDVIVIQKEGDPIITRAGDPIYKFTVADKTGTMLLSVWGERGQCIKSGDILHLANAESRIRKGKLEMEALRMTKVKRLGQDTFPFVEKPNYSEQAAIELQQQQQQQPPLSFSSSSTGPPPPLPMMPAFADRRPSPGPQQQRRGHPRGRGRGDPRRGRGMQQQ